MALSSAHEADRCASSALIGALINDRCEKGIAVTNLLRLSEFGGPYWT
jgi:hypothetical protein